MLEGSLCLVKVLYVHLLHSQACDSYASELVLQT